MKRSRAWLIGVASAAALSLAPAAPAQPAPVRGIWISPFTSTAVIPSVARMIRARALDTMVIPVFYDGRTIYPSRIFPQHERYMGFDPAAAVIAEAHARGMSVWAGVDLLCWQSSDNPSPAVANHPEWIERTAEAHAIGDVRGAPGAFVSPCEPRVKSLLTDLMQEMASRYEFDGLVLNCARWSRLDFLGYADADRKLYLQERRADPLDIDLLGYATPDAMIQALVRWQEQRITAVTQAAAQAFRAGRPQAVVLVVVEPNYYAARVTNPVRQDWRSWLGQGWLTAVMPDGLTYGDAATARSQLRAATGSEAAPVIALIRSSRALPAGLQVRVASSLGLGGFILWARDSLQQRRQVLGELGGL